MLTKTAAASALLSQHEVQSHAEGVNYFILKYSNEDPIS